MKNVGCLFDLDGVLIDSESIYTQFWTEIERIYPTGIANYAVAIKGSTLPEIMKHYDDASVRADIVRRINKFQDTMTYTIYDGVEQFMTQLRRHQIPAAIVTSSDDRKMKILFDQLPGFSDYFDAIIDASMVTRSKPDPQPYQIGAKALGLTPDQCYVFEDSLQGLASGAAAGAKAVIALATTYPRTTLIGKAAKIIDGFHEFTVEEMLEL